MMLACQTGARSDGFKVQLLWLKRCCHLNPPQSAPAPKTPPCPGVFMKLSGGGRSPRYHPFTACPTQEEMDGGGCICPHIRPPLLPPGPDSPYPGPVLDLITHTKASGSRTLTRRCCHGLTGARADGSPTSETHNK